MPSIIPVPDDSIETCSRSVALDVPAHEVFDFCTSCAGFLAHYPNPVRSYRGAERWVLGSEFWLDYRYFGMPMTWHGKITAYEHDRSFTDHMVSGMFRYWEHTHGVEPMPGGSRYTDTVRFSLGLGRWVDRVVVRRSLDTFFQRRHELLRSALRARLQPAAARESRESVRSA